MNSVGQCSRNLAAMTSAGRMLCARQWSLDFSTFGTLQAASSALTCWRLPLAKTAVLRLTSAKQPATPPYLGEVF